MADDLDLDVTAGLVLLGTVAFLTQENEESGGRRKTRKRKEQRAKTRQWIRKRDSGRGSLSMLNNELRLEDPDSYRNYLRMDAGTFDSLLSLVTRDIGKVDTFMRDAIPARSRLEITLRFLATGETYRSLMYATRVHESTISRFVPEVCTAIYNNLEATYLKMPTTEEEWQQIAGEFYDRWDFPHCLGALDGRHIKFKAPHTSGSYYYNYKGNHSIVLPGLVDAKYKFLYVNVGVNGRVSDGGVFRESSLSRAIASGCLNFPKDSPLPGRTIDVPYIFVADDAFPLGPRILKPYSTRNLTHDCRIFNYRLSRARRMVESSFGILANRFRVLLNTINLSVEKVEQWSFVM